MPAIVARGLKRAFGERVAVDDLSFEVHQGEIFGLLGPNGAGKTTTVRLLCGLLAPTAGEAEVCGLRLGPQSGEIRRRVGLLTEQPGLYDRLSARANLLYFARLYGVPADVAAQRMDGLLRAFGLAGRADDKVGGFSKGMRQKLAIARALIHEPQVVFLDEPTSGLDPEASAVVRGIVEDLARQGRTIVLCTHNLDEAERLCGRVAVVKGRIIALGPPAQLVHGSPKLEIRVAADAARLAGALGPCASADGEWLRVELSGADGAPEVVARLVGMGARIREVRPAGRELERVYLELVQGASAP